MRTTFMPNQYAICSAMLCTAALVASSVSAQEFFVTVGKGTLNRQVDAHTVRPTAVEPYHFTAALYGALPDDAPRTLVRTPQGVWLPMHSSFLDRSFASRAALDAAFPNGTYSVAWYYSGVPYQADVRVAGNAYPNTPYIVNWDWAHDIDTSVDFPLKFVPLASANPDDFIILEPFVSPVFPRPQIDPAATSITIPAGLLEPNQTVHLRLLFFRTTGLHVPAENPVVAGYGGYYRATHFTIRGGAPPPPQGRIQFSDDSFTASESDGAVYITVTRTGATQGTATVLVNTVDDSATAIRDYISYGFPQTVFFDEGVFVQQVRIHLYNEMRLRGDRQFYVVLSDVTGGAEIRQPNSAVVTIKEDESVAVGEAYFSQGRYSVSETDGFARLKVLRSGDFTRAMTVQYATVVHERRVPPDEARPGKDFVPIHSIVRFEEGQGEVELTIPILDDADFELPEHFQVRLSDPSAGGSLDYSRYSASVYIRSDELPNLTGERSVSGYVKVTGCGLRGGRANGVIQFQSQEGSQFVATGSLEMPHGRITQTFRGQVTADGQFSGSYSWRGNGDRGTGSFTGRTERYYGPYPFFILSFGGRSRIYGCRQAGDVTFPVPPGSVPGISQTP